MARAASSNSGTKYSSHSKRRPVSSIAGIMYVWINSSAGAPSSSARRVTATAVFRSPSTIASNSSW
jgi:hypothetical protein